MSIFNLFAKESGKPAEVIEKGMREEAEEFLQRTFRQIIVISEGFTAEPGCRNSIPV